MDFSDLFVTPHGDGEVDSCSISHTHG